MLKYIKHVLVVFTISMLVSIGNSQVEPLMGTNWDQWERYNDMAPPYIDENGNIQRAAAGCVAIALGQIMYYYQYPPAPLQSNSNVIYTFRYNIEQDVPIYISEDLSDFYFDFMCEETSANEIAELVYVAGVAAESDFSPEPTNSDIYRAFVALKERLGYNSNMKIIKRCNNNVSEENCLSSNKFIRLVKKQLDLGRVVYFRGKDPVKNKSHAMVIDGYNQQDQFHINMGNGPNLNGYFYLSNVTLGDRNYYKDQMAIINICSPVCNGFVCNSEWEGEILDSDPLQTRLPISCPNLLYPLPGQRGVSNRCYLRWSEVELAHSYILTARSLSDNQLLIDSIEIYGGHTSYEDTTTFPFNDSIEVIINSVDALGEVSNCTSSVYYTDTTNCALRILRTNPICLTDTSFNLTVNFIGIPGHTYDLWVEDTSGVVLSNNGVVQGEYTFGPFSTSASIAAVVEDEAQPYDCYHGVGVERIRCVFCPEIGLSVTSNYCLADVINLNVNVEVDTSTIIDLYTTIEGVNTFNDVGSGNYTFTDIPSGEDFLVIAEDTSKPNDCNRIIYVEALQCSGDSTETIIQTLEFFIDTDPGYGNGSTIPVPSSYNLVINHAINLDTLNPGVHILYIRAMDELGLWGYTVRKLFYIRPETEGLNRLLSDLEYFIDTDPGTGLGIPLTLVNNTNSIDSYLIPLDTLNQGIHVLYVRGKDNAGNWSYTSRKLFYIRSESDPSNRLLTSLEYFIDSDPGAGMGIPLTLENDTNSIDSYLLPLDTITSGVHVLYVRGKDNAGNWSYTSRKLFYIRPGSESPNRLLTDLEYFIDTDPGAGMGTPLTLENDTNSIDSYLLPLDTLNPGIHILYVRGKDNAGNWSYTSRKLFYIKPGSESPNRLLTDLEYFIDTDPGFGLGTPLALDNDTNSIALYDIALEAFTPGLHHLFVRGKDNQGDWGFTIVKTFTIYVLGPIVYVDWDATGANIGTSWTNAFSRLEPALLLATLYDTIEEIWIAQGVYKPTSTADRNISFIWADSTKLYGGFIGTETERNQRTSDPTLVILSGDIGISSDSTDNTYHVVVIDSTCQGCYLDRLTIKLGNASGSTNNNDKGAGIYSLGHVEIKDVVVEYSSAALTGAAIYNIGSGADLRMMNCIIRFNNSSSGHDIHNVSGANIQIQGSLQIED